MQENALFVSNRSNDGRRRSRYDIWLRVLRNLIASRMPENLQMSAIQIRLNHSWRNTWAIQGDSNREYTTRFITIKGNYWWQRHKINGRSSSVTCNGSPLPRSYFRKYHEQKANPKWQKTSQRFKVATIPRRWPFKRTSSCDETKSNKWIINSLATDLAARGIDIEGVSHVISLLPCELEFFIHRVGRTGHGLEGTAITFHYTHQTKRASHQTLRRKRHFLRNSGIEKWRAGRKLWPLSSWET